MKSKAHFIGIGGIGMSGLAHILLSKGIEVSGSDRSRNANVEALEKQGATIHLGHAASHIPEGAVTIYSSGIPKENPEWQAARERKHRSELLAELMLEKKGLAVAGTHGKTTTSSLLAWTLSSADFQPSFAIGGVVPQLGSNAGVGAGEHFVAEADESDGTFLNYRPEAAIVTNIGLDHLEHYGSERQLLSDFRQFITQVTGTLFWCGDDERLQEMKPQGIAYGLSAHNALRVTNVRNKGWNQLYDIDFEGRRYMDVEISLTGAHNVLNSLAVFGLSLSLGVNEEQVREAFRTFSGVNRRCQVKGEQQGVLVLDDYAHHPTEIATTLEGIRKAIGQRRLVAIFQPHRYSRTRSCLGSYGGIFSAADVVVVKPIFSAGEPEDPMVLPKLLEEIPEACGDFELRPHDVVVTLGAGDITHEGERLLEQSVKKWKIGVLYGGRSCEHEISKISAETVLKGLDPTFYEIKRFEIGRDGSWNWEGLSDCDVAFPVLHGPFGEDGTLQGMLEILDIPYVGCDHRSAAIAMDKVVCKQLALHAGIATAPFVDREFPAYVKGAHLGSSLGIYRVENEQEWDEAFKKARELDSKVFAEKEVRGREIEFGLWGNEEVHVLTPGEYSKEEGFCDFDKKYGEEAVPFLPAKLTPEQLEEGTRLAKQVYRLIGCMGWARIDFFLDIQGKFWFSEVNPIPGMTPTSGYPLMLAASGMSVRQFLDNLIILALARARRTVQ